MSTPNPHEERAREAKAQQLARSAVEALIRTAADVKSDFWPQLLEANERWGAASDETKARVVAILRSLRPVKMEGWSNL